MLYSKYYIFAVKIYNQLKKMKRIKFILFLVVVLILSACGTTQTVPITGRKHNLLFSDSEILSYSSQEYSKYMQGVKKSTDAASTAMVQRVGKRLASAVNTYLKNNNMASEIQNYSWEFNLVADKEVNAFCMPGGKIVVYEGLLPVTQNEASLAIVLGHEIAHAVAKHSAEQMSKKARQQYGTMALGTILNSAVGSGTGDIASGIAGDYFSFRNLKYSRDNESEADYMGLIFAAMAGYNPEVAVPFWTRMAEQGGSSNNNDLFSDHPSDSKRIAAIEKLMPDALKYYQASGYVNNNNAVKKSTRKSVRR